MPTPTAQPPLPRLLLEPNALLHALVSPPPLPVFPSAGDCVFPFSVTLGFLGNKFEQLLPAHGLMGDHG